MDNQRTLKVGVDIHATGDTHYGQRSVTAPKLKIQARLTRGLTRLGHQYQVFSPTDATPRSAGVSDARF